MNKTILIGRLVRDPEVRYVSPAQGGDSLAIARYRLAVDRIYGRNQEQTADFIPCAAFGKSADFAEKYLRQGMKIAVSGHLQTGSYTNKDGQKIFTMELIIESQEFVEKKSENTKPPAEEQPEAEEFIPIPDDIEGMLPF